MKFLPLLAFSMILAPAPAHAGKCRICGAETTTRCGRCKEAFYCKPACQKKDWPAHKSGCGAPSSPSAAVVQAAKERLGIQVEFVCYEYPDYPGDSRAYAFTGSLDGKNLAISATDGKTTVDRKITLE